MQSSADGKSNKSQGDVEDNIRMGREIRRDDIGEAGIEGYAGEDEAGDFRQADLTGQLTTDKAEQDNQAEYQYARHNTSRINIEPSKLFTNIEIYSAILKNNPAAKLKKVRPVGTSRTF